MSCDLFSLATTGVAGLQPYHAGKSIEELQRELGLNEIIKLASNENPLGPSQKVLDAIASTKNLSRYPDGNGFSLKKALNIQHQVIYSQHSFSVYSIVTQAVGAEHIVVPSNEWGHDLSAMLAAVTNKTRLMFIANPNNPTGTWIDSECLRHLLENVPAHVIVLVDEAYFEYASVEENYPDASLWLNEFRNLIVTRTFSKAYGLAGLRVGYGLSHPDIANLLNRVRQPFNNNSLALIAAEAALHDGNYIKQSITINQSGMQTLIKAFDSLGLGFIPSKGNFICADFKEPTEGIYQALMKTGIIVRSVANYGMPNPLQISIGLESENVRFINGLTKIMAV